MTITFIHNPPYCIDFRQFCPSKEKIENLSFYKKIQKVGVQCIQCFVLAFKEATYKTFSYSLISFKHIVLGYYGSIKYFHFSVEDIYLMAFRIVFWVAEISWCLVTTTNRLFIEKFRGETHPLISYNDEINTTHIRTKELVLDASLVPQSIQVEDLINFFNEINFDHSLQPGFISIETCKEGSTSYTRDKLHEGLSKFVDNIKKRKPFLGTPPSYDTPRLMEFYQHIEDAIRLSLYKISQVNEEFNKGNGKNIENYNLTQLAEYTDLLHMKARLAIDLAIAGQYCGARYMGDVTEAYDRFYGGNIRNAGDLSDYLIEILAQKRKEIAKKRIALDLGNGTHAFNKYMANLGKILGIPGTQNIVEHIDNQIDQFVHLEKFFTDYTVEVIIETIQEEIKKSQVLREKIIDWIKDQVSNWNTEAYHDRLNNLVPVLNKILEEKNEDISDSTNLLKTFENLISHLNLNHFSIDNSLEWNDFFDELLALPEVKKWYENQNFLDSSKMSESDKIKFIATEKNKLKRLFSVEVLGSDLINMIKQSILFNHPLPIDLLNQRFFENKKIHQIQQNISLNKETIHRILKNQISLEVALKDCLNLERCYEFIDKLQLEELKTQGVSSEIMEWLLVSQKILLPQIEKERE